MLNQKSPYRSQMGHVQYLYFSSSGHYLIVVWLLLVSEHMDQFAITCTELAPRPIQYISCNVSEDVCPLLETPHPGGEETSGRKIYF